MLTNTPKDTLTSFQALLDIAQGVKALASNPDLDNLVKDAYALPEAEQAKADAARQAIADNQAVLAQIKKSQTELENTSTELDTKKQEIALGLQAIDDRSKVLSQKEKDLTLLGSQLSDKAASLQQKERDLQAGVSKLTQDKEDLAKKWEEVNEYETSLKAKADQLKSLTAGM